MPEALKPRRFRGEAIAIIDLPPFFWALGLEGLEYNQDFFYARLVQLPEDLTLTEARQILESQKSLHLQLKFSQPDATVVSASCQISESQMDRVGLFLKFKFLTFHDDIREILLMEA